MKNIVVVDANIALKWVLSESDSSVASNLLASWLKNGITIMAPALLAYEATNTLYRNMRSGKITSSVAVDGLNLILKIVKLDFSYDPIINIQAMKLAERFGQPASYDSHYLALAEREGCELWTDDTRMWRAIKGKLDWVRCLNDYHEDEKSEIPDSATS
jgi:predicted nucleic acid-binding protein